MRALMSASLDPRSPILVPREAKRHERALLVHPEPLPAVQGPTSIQHNRVHRVQRNALWHGRFGAVRDEYGVRGIAGTRVVEQQMEHKWIVTRIDVRRDKRPRSVVFVQR